MNEYYAAYAANPTDPEAARKFFAEELKEQGAKLFRVTLKGLPGMTYDAIVVGESEEDVIECAVEEMSSISGGDLDKEAVEVK